MKGYRPQQGGFTLVEVLVASAIAIASMGLLLSLFAGSLDRMSRIELQSQQLIAEKEILGRLSLVNPAATRSGKGTSGQWAYSWSARQLTEFRKITDDLVAETPPGDVALFLIRIEMRAPHGKTVELSIRRLGRRT
mgnify:FL=1